MEQEIHLTRRYARHPAYVDHAAYHRVRLIVWRAREFMHYDLLATFWAPAFKYDVSKCTANVNTNTDHYHSFTI
jgi:hypothetical protein